MQGIFVFVPIWKRAPFSRLLLPLIIGIILEWYMPIAPILLWSGLIFSLLVIVVFFFVPFFERFKLSIVNGFSISLLFIAIGALLVHQNNITKNSNWFGHKNNKYDMVRVKLLEPLIEKPNSYKAEASVDYISQNKTTGKIIIYFEKDVRLNQLNYGSQIIFKQNLHPIKNSGNPGGFDYRRYTFFQQITHQVYLKKNDYEILPLKNKKIIPQLIIFVREKVLSVLQKYIKGNKELGLAEALLIGYKDDLDKTLVQSYTNTGVVHIIAISGLHIGIIYWLLLQLLQPLQTKKKHKWIKPLIIICSLWLFSLVAGGQPSVLRSAVMFTCIALGESFSRRTSILNSMALSAFLLLCYNPYWLWDVGFQLSYAAVLSIVIFMRPIYEWITIQNKLLDFIWKLNAVTLSAQILTFPICIYYFHQFPNYFLVSNFVAVPLSSIILVGEIFLCTIFYFPVLATVFGNGLSWLIYIMNSFIENVEMLPFSVWNNLTIGIVQVILLYGAIAAISYWLMEKSKLGLQIGLAFLLNFFVLRTISLINIQDQKKIIVYNVPKEQVVDFIYRQRVVLFSNSKLKQSSYYFNIKPSRIFHRAETAKQLPTYFESEKCFQFNSKRIIIIDTTIKFIIPKEKILMDLLIISKNPKLYFSQLNKTFSIKQVVFDGSTSKTKLKYWKKDCDSLHIPYHDVTESGAFVMHLN